MTTPTYKLSYFLIALTFLLIGNLSNGFGQEVTIDNPTGPAVTEGQTMSFPITISPANSTDDITVEYSISGTVSAGDYNILSAQPLVINSGNTSATIEIEIVDDSDVEGSTPETLTVTLDDATNATVGSPSSGSGNITDNDVAPDPEVSIANAAGVTEGQTMSFPITLSAANSTDDITVEYSISGTVSASDYNILSAQPLVITSGNSSATIEIEIVDDSDVEGSTPETLTVTLDDATNATVGSPSSGSGNITDNDVAPDPEVSIADAAGVTEGQTMSFPITLSAANSTDDVTVAYSISGTVAASDYTILSAQPLVITSGNTSANIQIKIDEDSEVENPETLTVTLNSATNATVSSSSSGTGNITDNDVAPDPEVSIADAAGVTEGQTMSFPITLSAANSTDDVTVAYSISGTVAASDYTILSAQPLVITSGNTSANIQIKIDEDSEVENPETLTVTLNSATNATVGSPSSGTGNITDNDVAPDPEVSIADAAGVTEGQTMSFPITLSAANSTDDVTVAYSISGTVAASDYTILSAQPLVITSGNTSANIQIKIDEDSEVENPETLTVTLNSATNATVGSPSSGTGNITDNDSYPVLTIENGTGEEGEQISFRVNVSPTPVEDVTVKYSTTNGSASSTSDYTAASNQTLTINAGQNFGNILIDTDEDSNVEPDETFTVTLSSPTKATLGNPKTATGTIENDDSYPDLSIANASAEEGDDVVFTVTLSQASPETVTVKYNTTDGTAANGSDYTGASNRTLTIPSGDTQATIRIETNDDQLDETSESFTITLSNEQGATIISGTATGTITDNDDQPQLSISGDSKGEGNSLTFTVELNRATYQNVTVNYTTVDGTAKSGSDYTANNGTLTFTPGQTEKTITVLTTGDNDYEADETLSIKLSNISNSTFASGDQATGTITNDDPKPKISITDDSKSEGATLSFDVTLGSKSYETITVKYATANATATAGTSADYTAKSGTLSFAPGETSKTIEVTTNDDAINEPQETFEVNLSDATNASINDEQGIGTINDNDGAPTIFINDVSRAEGQSLTFTISMSNASSQNITVTYQTVDGTAKTSDSDYTGVNPTQVTFAAGTTSKMVTINTTQDSKYETDETFTIKLSNASGGIQISDDEGLGTITNDDAVPTLSISDDSGAEGAILDFTVTLSHASGATVTVNYRTVDGTATSIPILGDYNSISSTQLEFAPGETAKTIQVTTRNDLFYESDETFTVVLSNPSNATLSDDIGVGTITNDDNRPTVSDVYKTGDEGSVVSFTKNDFASKFSDSDGDNLQRIKVVSLPNHGSLKLDGSTVSEGVEIAANDLNKLTFTPENEWSGETEFDWNGFDGSNYAQYNAQVIINIGSVNDSPRAENDLVTTNEDTPANGNVLDNDSDPDGDQLTVTGYNIQSSDYEPGTTVPIANVGTVVIQANGQFQFTPEAEYHGQVPNVQYTIQDEDENTANATLTITVTEVNDAPEAVDDLASTPAGTTLTGNVLDNDYDIENDPIKVINFGTSTSSYPAGQTATIDQIGTITINEDGTFTYISDENYTGEIQGLIYTIQDDGELTASASLRITVTEGEAVTVAVDDQFSTGENTEVQGNVIENDQDGDGGNNLTVNTTLVSEPSHGTVQISANGDFTYTPDTDYSGQDQFSYETCNSDNSCDQATVTIVISDVNLAPVAMDDNFLVEMNGTFTGSVIANDSDPDNNEIQITTEAVTEPANGNLIINTDGTISYTPDLDFTGTDSFQYQICDDGEPSECATATVTITVMEIIPVAVPDQVVTGEDTPIDIYVADNDSATFDLTTIQIIESPTYGTAASTGLGIITYTPNTGFSGFDSFIYEICDNESHCDTAIVKIQVGSGEPELPAQVFTPNGDGENDTYVIKGIENYPNNKFTVFNRWGSVVYEKSGYKNEWTGESNSSITVGGKPLPMGTYFYIIEYDEQQRTTGFIYISR